MKTRSMIGLLVAFFGLYLVLAIPAAVQAAAAKCPIDSVRVGPICVDKYEASVWETTNVALIKKIKAGTVTEAALIAGGAIQRGVSSDDYPCDNNGNDCDEIFAVSIAGVTPSSRITWFQAQQAAMNSGKRLLTNAEWQMAAAGTPDPGTDNGTTDCNIGNTFVVADTGSRSSCKSRFGVFDMVGNLWEWVADWVPLSTACGPPTPPSLFAGDFNCLAGASTTSGPGALVRGGALLDGTRAGVFAVISNATPSLAVSDVGFRAAR